MGSTVAARLLVLLLCLAVGDAVRQASMHKGDVVGAAQEYEKPEHKRAEHEHVQEGTAEEVADSKVEWGALPQSVWNCESAADCRSLGKYCSCSRATCHC